ncbi:MAG: gluconokinase [Gammaproteobacteria bacterium]|nr:gluconokinase [Gammaproteobacteria bacterium]
MTSAIVVMGVSGCGKSTLGRGIAKALGWQFIEGDMLHPPANIEKMTAGIPLDDADRWPFLANVAEAIKAAGGADVVVSCSALKRIYRDDIRARAGSVTFVLPLMSRAQLLQRLQARKNHFMPVSLLETQLETLELPGADEDVITLDGDMSAADQLAQVVAELNLRTGQV